MIPLLDMSDGDEPPVFHLRSYGCSTLAELHEYLKVGEIKANPLAAMCSHKDTHPQAWVEPVSTAKPAMAGLGVVAPLWR